MEQKLTSALELFGLKQIGSWYFIQNINHGYSSNILLYGNLYSHIKAINKLLIFPRNKFEINKFNSELEIALQCNEVAPHCYPYIYNYINDNEYYPVYYYLMEKIEGYTLNEFIQIHPLPWDWKQAVDIINKIACALCKISYQYIHKDLHMNNIILTSNYEFNTGYFEDEDFGIRILDFGLTIDKFNHFFGFEQIDKFRDFGAVSTWSPELFFSPESIEAQHDSWALGVILYRLLTNRHLLPANSLGDLIKALEELPKKIDFDVDLSIPEAVKMLIKYAVTLDPNKRLLPNEIYYFTSDILYKNLNSFPNSTIKFYIQNNCSLDKCLFCDSYVDRRCAKCPGCGKVAMDDNVISELSSV